MNITGTTYSRHFGYDWPEGTDRIFAALTIAKKWKLFRDRRGIVFDNPGDRLEEGLCALFPSLKMTPWTQTMIHDIAVEDEYAMIGGAASGKSHLLAAYAIATWITDPFDTACALSSATLTDLKHRAWSPVVELFAELKNNKLGFAIPGKLVTNQYAIINERDESIAETQAARAAIQGKSLEDGRLVGLHLPWVFFSLDEQGLVTDMEALKTALTNIRVGTLGFKFISAANPKPWDHPTSCFFVPPKGVTVTPDTGSWRSATGMFVRHFNGLKSPVVLNPELKAEYPFLMSQDDIDRALKMCDGNRHHPRFLQMVVGFPFSNSSTTPTVLDPLVAKANDVTGSVPKPFVGARRSIATAAGIDPAYSEHGDAAVNAGVEVVEQDGRVYLDFTGRVKRIPISALSPIPVMQQLRDSVIRRIHEDNGPEIKRIYVDSSGNQSLADVLDIYVGGGCGHVNNSARASENPVRAHDVRKAKDHIKDRGTEAWIVLAAFCEAGMVKGLPEEALKGLTTRQFATKPGSDDIVMPLRLEPKEQFISRFKGSPNETDACALAALAVKERLGIMPFGALPAPTPNSLFPSSQQSGPSMLTNADVDSDYSGVDYDSDGYASLD